MPRNSLEAELHSKGYLSLSKFVDYLKEYHPTSAVSYPTALRMIDSGKLRAKRVGAVYRLYKHEIDRFVRFGNFEGGDKPPSSSVR